MATDGSASPDGGTSPDDTSAPQGDIRVLLALDLLLSLLFSLVAVYALDLAGIGEFTPENVAVATLFLAAVTYVAVLR